ncbi:MAG: LysR substrate-binding domain-containing protein [Polaromonas sp.]|nr:LysR substrate-binding domain-containing protein [Polaromonas sp.]
MPIQLRSDLPIVYGRRMLLPVLGRLIERYSALELDVRLHDSYTDPIKDGIDLAVRVGERGDSRLVVRRFAQQMMVLCASPTYLQQHGTPPAIEELGRHAAVYSSCRAAGD